jgi:hypothetical protein
VEAAGPAVHVLILTSGTTPLVIQWPALAGLTVPLTICLFADDLAQLLSQVCGYRCLANGPVAYGSFELPAVVTQLSGRELADRVCWFGRAALVAGHPHLSVARRFLLAVILS